MVNDEVKFLRNRFFNKIYRYESYILDSNIVVKLRDLFYSPDRMENDEIEYWIGLLEFFKYKDVLPGLAIQELCWNFEEYRIDEIKLKRLGFAVDSLFTYDDFIYSRIRRREHYTGEISPISGGKRYFRSLYLNSDANILLLPTFCIMLKFYYVIEMYDDNKIRYIEICNFLKDTLKLVCGYELAFITDILFSTDINKTDHIKGMFKLKNKSNFMQKIWNSSWDIFFIRTITAFAANALSNNPTIEVYSPILVTRDKDLYSIGEFVNRKEHYKTIKKQIYPGIEFGSDYISEDFTFVKSVYAMLDTTKEKRIKMLSKMSYEERMEHYKMIIKSLEKDILSRLNVS